VKNHNKNIMAQFLSECKEEPFHRPGIYCSEVEFMDMERLDRVLRRVRGEENAICADDDRRRLEALIRGEETSRAAYGWLRNRCSGRPRAVLTQLWTEEDRHYRDLQAEYLARFGNTLPQETVSVTRNIGVLSALGRVREEEHAAVEEYLRGSRETGDHRLRLLFEKHAREEERHAKKLTELLHFGMR